METNTNDTRKEMIRHLSNEIKTNMEILSSFRLKGNFTMFYGPFIISGGIIIFLKGQNPNFHINYDAALCLVAAGFLWLLMGIMAAIVEKHIWDKCNAWRKCILNLSKEKSEDITEKELEFTHELIPSYIAIYGIQLIIFALITLAILFSMGTCCCNN